MYLPARQGTLSNTELWRRVREMPESVDRFYHLKNKAVSLVVDARGSQPAIAYFGARLANVNEPMIEQLDRHEAPASLPIEPAVTLSTAHGMGYLGHPGLAVHRGRNSWQVNPQLVACEASESELHFTSTCERLSVEITHCLTRNADRREPGRQMQPGSRRTARCRLLPFP